MHTLFGKVLLVVDRRHRAFGLTSLVLWFLALSFQLNVMIETGTGASRVILSVLVALFIVTHLRTGALKRARERGLRSALNFLYSTRYMSEISGVANGGTFLEDLHRAKDLEQRLATPSVVISVRLANIEEVRDRFGDGVGSKAIHEFSSTLGRITRGEDLVAYIGTGQFVILLGDCSFEQSAQFTQRIPATIAAVADGDSVTLRVETRRYDVADTECDQLMATVYGAFAPPEPPGAVEHRPCPAAGVERVA